MMNLFCACAFWLALLAPATAQVGIGTQPNYSQIQPAPSGGGAVTCTVSGAGNTKATVSTNTVYTFIASGSITCGSSVSSVHLLAIGGGGGGSLSGGGAGGYCTTEGTPTCSLGATVTVPSGATTITIGAGSAGVTGGTAASNGRHYYRRIWHARQRWRDQWRFWLAISLRWRGRWL